MRVLCSGDLHIGRRPTRLPAHVDTRALSCATAWGAVVDYAVDQRVDVVALSGDVVDQDNRYFEALGPLEHGLRRLASAGIDVVAVAGNHDFGVLPGLSRSLPDGMLRLLGVGGRWERTTITRNGESLHVDGWSFPTQHVSESPLASYVSSRPVDGPVLGLVHGDLEAPSSAYAPLALADLRAHQVDAWLLGHVHAAKLHEAQGRTPVLYPGSPQPLDPGEEGVHGIWMLHMSAGRPVRATRIPLATVCYAPVVVDVSAASDLIEARALVHEHLRSSVDALVHGAPLQHVSVRLRLTGRSALHRELDADAERIRADLELEVGDARVYVERVETSIRPAHDLDALGRSDDALAIVAGLLRDLETEAPGEHVGEILAAIAGVPGTLRKAKPYRSLASIDDEGSVLREALAREATRLLDSLVQQRETLA